MTYATLDWAKAAEIIRESGARNADAGILGLEGFATPILRDGVPTRMAAWEVAPLATNVPAIRVGGVWIACYCASTDADALAERTEVARYAFWNLRFYAGGADVRGQDYPGITSKRSLGRTPKK